MKADNRRMCQGGSGDPVNLWKVVDHRVDKKLLLRLGAIHVLLMKVFCQTCCIIALS